MGRRTPHQLELIRARYEHRKTNGLCIDCGATLQESDEGLSCVEHQAIRNASAARQRKKPRTKALHIAAKKKWVAAGRCYDCGALADGKIRCTYHRELCRVRVQKWRRRKKYGITPLKRKPTLRVDLGREEISRYQPVDEQANKPRARILLAIWWRDWSSAADLFDVLNVDRSDGGTSKERDTFSQALRRLVQMGLVEKQKIDGKYPDYRITDAGRAEVERIRRGDYTPHKVNKRAA